MIAIPGDAGPIVGHHDKVCHTVKSWFIINRPLHAALIDNLHLCLLCIQIGPIEMDLGLLALLIERGLCVLQIIRIWIITIGVYRHTSKCDILLARSRRKDGYDCSLRRVPGYAFLDRVSIYSYFQKIGLCPGSCILRQCKCKSRLRAVGYCHRDPCVFRLSGRQDASGHSSFFQVFQMSALQVGRDRSSCAVQGIFSQNDLRHLRLRCDQPADVLKELPILIFQSSLPDIKGRYPLL